MRSIRNANVDIIKKHWIYELEHLVNPSNVNTILQICRLRMQKNMCVSDIIPTLENVSD